MSRKPPTPLPETDDPYVLLDVRPGASADQIRRAYLRRVKVFKPDRYPAEFRRIREAYDRLREQETWFDAWRQANEVVRQAREHAEHADAEDPPSGGSGEGSGVEGSAHDGPMEEGPGVERHRLGAEDEPSDEDLRAEARQQAEAASDEPPVEQMVEQMVEQIMAEVEAERRAGREPPGHEPQPDDASRGPSASDDGAALVALTEAVHAELVAGRYAQAAVHLTGDEGARLAARPEFSALLLEVCCAVVWAAPPRFDDLVARYGDLIAARDTEHRDGNLLHRRILIDELAAWSEVVSGWPRLHRFVVLGASLRPPDEAELGLHLGREAADDPAGFLAVLHRAAERAPGIVSLYVDMAERWSRLYDGEGPRRDPAPPLPTVDEAAAALVDRLRTHRRVRWEQVKPVLALVILGVVAASPLSIVVELVAVAVVIALRALRGWAEGPEERIYRFALRPTAAGWLWTTGCSPEELAAALSARLPARGTWDAVLHPGRLFRYPLLLGNDLALLAFGVTAPLIPRLGHSDPEPLR